MSASRGGGRRRVERAEGADLLSVFAHRVGELGALQHLGNAERGASLAAGKFGLGEDMTGCGLLELTRTPDEESAVDGRIERVEHEYEAMRTAFIPADATVAAKA